MNNTILSPHILYAKFCPFCGGLLARKFVEPQRIRRGNTFVKVWPVIVHCPWGKRGWSGYPGEPHAMPVSECLEYDPANVLKDLKA